MSTVPPTRADEDDVVVDQLENAIEIFRSRRFHPRRHQAADCLLVLRHICLTNGGGASRSWLLFATAAPPGRARPSAGGRVAGRGLLASEWSSPGRLAWSTARSCS